MNNINSENLVRDAMLMAAGLGTRLRPFTDQVTKALLPVMGVPIVQYSIDNLVHAGVDQLVINVHHRGDQSRNLIESLDLNSFRQAGRPEVRLKVSDETRLLLGSAGGIRKAIQNFEGRPFFLANADVLCEMDWFELARRHARLRAEFGVVLTLAIFSKGPLGAQYREIYFDPKTLLITGFGDLAEGRPYFVGAAVMEAEALRDLPEGIPAEFVPSILAPAIRAGKAGAFVSDGAWFDIGAPELWLKAHLGLSDLLEKNENDKNQNGSFSFLNWKKRIMSENLRLSKGVWVHRRFKNADDQSTYKEWHPPCYWDAEGNPPLEMGPQSVLYGTADSVKVLGRGIGYSQTWLPLE